MKKLTLILTIFLTLISTNCFAAWTMSTEVVGYERLKNDRERFQIKVTAYSDGTDPGILYLDDANGQTAANKHLTTTQINALKGSVLTGFIYTPTQVTAGTWNVTITNNDGISLIPLTNLSNSVAASVEILNTYGVNTMFGLFGLDFSDIGNSGDSIIIILTFDK